MKTDYYDQSELQNCYFIKTVLMLFILLGHSIDFWNGDWFTYTSPAISAELLPYLSKFISSFHVYGFVLVSGYIFYYVKYERGGYKNFKQFLYTKCKRLIVPYVFVAVFWVIPIEMLFNHYDTAYLVKSFLLGEAPNQLWFVLMMFWLFIIFFFLSNYMRTTFVKGLIVVLLFWGAGVIGSVLIPNYFRIWSACENIPIFWVGFKLRQVHTKNRKRSVPTVAVLCMLVLQIALLFIVECIYSRDTYFLKALILLLKLIIHINGAVVAFVLLQKIAYSVPWNNNVFSFLSKHSMPIYLFHQQIIYFVIVILNGKINPYVHAGITFSVALILASLISYILTKNKYTKFLIGEK